MKLSTGFSDVPARSLQKPEALQTAARALEAQFLAEMLKASGAGKSRATFGGGVGEDAFAGLLVQKQAELMAEKGGLGLTENIVKSLMNRDSHA